MIEGKGERGGAEDGGVGRTSRAKEPERRCRVDVRGVPRTLVVSVEKERKVAEEEPAWPSRFLGEGEVVEWDLVFASSKLGFGLGL